MKCCLILFIFTQKLPLYPQSNAVKNFCLKAFRSEDIVILISGINRGDPVLKKIKVFVAPKIKLLPPIFLQIIMCVDCRGSQTEF